MVSGERFIFVISSCANYFMHSSIEVELAFKASHVSPKSVVMLSQLVTQHHHMILTVDPLFGRTILKANCSSEIVYGRMKVTDPDNISHHAADESARQPTTLLLILFVCVFGVILVPLSLPLPELFFLGSD